ncbi:hypothetical protein DL764_009871 [Monosporascus ibericus]|uniref:Uncharacterized protein n=1 Tax=Monosporascus ibericus TaxID=155417 RepID=A0A4Q4STX8_9PEZI|nr:hypothetical protein DL764_009871 [Monosporascus ibericus]
MSSTAQAAVSTPSRAPTQPVQESPGTWRHPRLAEITRRQEATTFTEKNVRRIAVNVAILVALIAVKLLITRVLPSKQNNLVNNLHKVICFVPVFNIGANLFPLVRPQDDLSDIPLTPGQRRLLGLPPPSKPPTPGSVYSTPPRFSRTPSVGSAGSRRSFSGSPVSNRASPANGNGGSLGGSLGGLGSPSSPLLQKAMNGARRSSIGSLGSPSFNASLGASFNGSLGASFNSSVFGGDIPSSPSPATGKRSSISLNNKWLYEKGRERRSSGSARLFA